MGFFGFKKTSLNVDGREVIVDESTITFSPDEKNPFKEWEKDENQKNKKFVIFGICLNGEFRPDILQKWQQIQKGDGSHEIRNTIKKGLKIIDEMLRKKINKLVGCQDKDLIDENGEIGVGFLEQMFIMNEDGGGSGFINWELKNKVSNNVRLAVNYKNECKKSKKKGMICKIEPQFVNESIKQEVKKMIESKLEEAIENLVNQWLNKGNWLERKFCNFVSVSINKSPHGYDCLKTGQMGRDNHLRKDIKQLVNSLNGSGEMNIEIGEWWLAGRWKQSNKKWGRKDAQNEVRGVTEKLIEFSGSVGQLREQTLKKAVKELVEEFEKGIIKRREGFCGVWNEGVTCPEGGVVI